MSVVALEAVVEKGAIRLDAPWSIPDQTKVFVLIPDIETAQSEPPVDSRQEASADPKQGSVLELARYLQRIALTPGKEKVKLTDFAGVGAELWSSIDVDAYIDEERSSWERSWTE